MLNVSYCCFISERHVCFVHLCRFPILHTKNKLQFVGHVQLLAGCFKQGKYLSLCGSSAENTIYVYHEKNATRR